MLAVLDVLIYNIHNIYSKVHKNIRNECIPSYENEADGFLPCCAANGQEEIIQSRGMEKSTQGKGWVGLGSVSKDGGE